MSKLSPSLKALVNAPFARPHPPKRTEERMRAVFTAIAADAAKHNVGFKPWVTLASATTFTHNIPEGLTILQDVASTTPSAPLNPVQTAELIREVGLKCISFNGIPRSINLLNAFHDSLPAEITSRLETRPSRAPTPENIAEITARGRSLWDSVYRPFEDKLVDRLARSHPDLPVHILNSHYAPILSDPAPEARGNLAGTGRILTSLIALACLRAQTGVGPQVLSHVFGLRKAIEDGTYKAEGQEEVVGAEWLAGDEGSEWILRTVDSISEALGPNDLAKGIREGWKEAEKAKL
ncbi:related to conserved mitochondrial protein [Cephalotrichum gorgonifer]|uniref:Related to conserved mitochondrial protein n=1 Tax=Cephalotrichum gorgonifer TaxID=2041049 RepID=A0AAE8N4Q3_9PEZI|nr:related to conserved mitochondrial protein [Cephalotrichum gorgonifer]